MQPPTGHVIAPSAVPVWAPWLAAAVMYSSALALAVVRRGRWMLLTAGALGVAGTVAVFALSPTIPASPAYTITLALPAAPDPVTSPVLVMVCARLRDGSSVGVPDARTLVTVFLDGRQVLETQRMPVAVEARPGMHELRAELLTTDHREFRPPLSSARVSVLVQGSGPLRRAAQCPRG